MRPDDCFIALCCKTKLKLFQQKKNATGKVYEIEIHYGFLLRQINSDFANVERKLSLL